MEKIEMVRTIGSVQSGLTALRVAERKTEIQNLLTEMHDDLDKVLDGLIEDAKNGA